MKHLLFSVTFLLSCIYTIAQKKPKSNSRNTIIIEGQVPSGYNKDFIEVNYKPDKIAWIGYSKNKAVTDTLKIVNGTVKWQIEASAPVVVRSKLIDKLTYIGPTLEPGDHIFVKYVNDNPVFSGKGAAKLELEHRLEQVYDSMNHASAYKSLTDRSMKPASFNDYLNWNSFLNTKQQLILSYIEAYKPRLSPFAYTSIKVNMMSLIEEIRVYKFSLLRGKADPEKKKNTKGEYLNEFGLSDSDLAAVFDSTIENQVAHWLMYEANMVNNVDYPERKLTIDTYRDQGTFFKKPGVTYDYSVLGNEVDYFIKRYHLCRKKYPKLIQEATLSNIFWNNRGILHECGFPEEVENILSDYYAYAHHPEYIEAVKEAEVQYRELFSRKFVADFTLTDTNGKPFTKEMLKGKVAVMDFWFTGCIGCVQMAPVMAKVEEQFKHDSNVVFLNISIDRDKERWLQSIAQKKYTSGTGINLYTGGQGGGHEMIRKYGVTGYPTIYIIDGLNRLLWTDKIPDPRSDNGQRFIELLQNQIQMSKDGPYLFYDGTKGTSYSVYGTEFNQTTFHRDDAVVFPVATDQSKTFNVSLQKQIAIPPSEYPRPEKLLALSDIEGNFDAFRKLLQANKVIDENYNWIFGDGHLVFAGDMFDRGAQVTECLWLVYYLEEKARAAGGYVHFILGNHDIMNLYGDIRYVHDKYQSNAKLIGKSLIQLYGEDTELGKWLRSKNIIERIGDLLFMHGGVSPQINEAPVTVADINQLARPYYAEHKEDYGSKDITTIMNSSGSIFWYRGYYKPDVPKSLIDSTLQKFNVSRIITGHTIVADTISVHYDGKVINTDTDHAEGKSEALLIEGDRFYRVNAEGRRILLFIEEKKNTVTIR